MNELFESSYLSAMSEMNNKLREENNQLQSNWNSLRELIIKRLDRYDRLVSKEEGIEIEILMWVRDKMNELEGESNDN